MNFFSNLFFFPFIYLLLLSFLKGLLFQKVAENGTLPSSSYMDNITLIQTGTKISQKKRKLQANITDEHRHRKPQQTLKTKSSNTLKESYALIKWDLSQECQNSSLYTNQPMWPTTLTNGRIWSYQ